MNQLWHLSSHHTLKLFRTNWISSPCVQLHSVYMKKHFQCQNIVTQTEYRKNRVQNNRNDIQIDIRRRSSVSSPNKLNGSLLLKDIRNNIDPYLRLIRADRPIGNLFEFKVHSSKKKKDALFYTVFVHFILEQDPGYYFGHVDGVSL